MKYFPMLRGRRNEVMSLRRLANEISSTNAIVPILEPVNWNSTTKIGIQLFIDTSMNFLLICNPKYGDFEHDPSGLLEKIDEIGLTNHESWIPSMYVYETTREDEISEFRQKYNSSLPIAFVYYGRPNNEGAQREIRESNVAHHVFVGAHVDSSYIRSIPINKQVLLQDRFRRKARNADYPEIEFFTDMNTLGGNSKNVNFGDFSIVGDYFQKHGGPAHAVALHHIHFDKNSNNLMVSHFISDRRKTSVDTAGKTIEALGHLINRLDERHPNDTKACEEYKKLFDKKHSSSLGYMKGLAIRQHLETILNPKRVG